MRLTSAMWLGVFMRLESERGAFVTVVKKGAQEAGALFVVKLNPDHTADIYGPAPQTSFSESDINRKFELVLQSASREDMDLYFEKQKRFDSDLWIIETESGKGEISLEISQ